MVKELDYQKNRLILESWQVVRQQNDYHVQVGTSLYKKFFQRCPKAKTLFGWPAGMPVNSELLLKSKAYLAQSAMYVSCISDTDDSTLHIKHWTFLFLTLWNSPLTLMPDQIVGHGCRHAWSFNRYVNRNPP